MTRAPEDLRALLTLLAAPGIRQPRACELLLRHGSAEAALASLPREAPDADAAARSATVSRRVDRLLRSIEEGQVAVIACTDPGYPVRLARRLGDSRPPALFAKGDLSILERTGIAVVGCRAATEYGLDVAGRIAEGVAATGGCVVSGLARGIDGAAHRAALETDGATAAVLGCGIDVHYPHENAELQDRIAEGGLLLSEFLPGEPPLRYHFPYRNRIIAALSAAVVVVEATKRSGAVHTAEHAMHMGVDVFGVPNAIDLPNTQGVLDLLRDGARLFMGTRFLLEETGLIGIGQPLPDGRPPIAPPVDPLQVRVWDRLTGTPKHVDALASETDLPPQRVLTALLAMEIEGRVLQAAGGRFARARPVRARRRPPDAMPDAVTDR